MTRFRCSEIELDLRKHSIYKPNNNRNSLKYNINLSTDTLTIYIISLKTTDLMISVMSLIVKTLHFHVGQFTYKIHNTILRLIHKFVYADINIK